MVSSVSKFVLRFIINCEIVGESVEIPAVDLAKLWVLADRFLMPRLQNPVMKKLGDPDSWWSHNPKVLNPPEDSSITAHKELIAYVNSTEGRDTPLKRYCTRLLLSRIEGSFEDEDMNPPDYQAQCKSEVHSVTGTG